jgi:hypothetical protein
MAKAIVDGRPVYIVVEHAGPKFNIWRFHRGQNEFEVFCNYRGGMSINFTGDDAEKLSNDLQALKDGALTSEALEHQLEQQIEGFLQTIEQ